MYWKNWDNMKIAFVTPGGYMEQEDYEKGNLLGTEYQIFELAKELVKKGCEVYIFRRWYENRLEVINNITVLSFKSSKSLSPLVLTFNKLKFSLEVAKNIKEMNFDILIGCDPFTAYFSYKLPLIKVSLTHSQIPYDLIEKFIKTNNICFSLKTQFLKIIQNNFFLNSDIIISLNTEIHSYFIAKEFPSVLIPNGINLERYIVKNEDKNYILFGGRLVKEKRVHNLLIAYSKLNRRLRSNYGLKITGFGPEENKLKKLAKELGLGKEVEFIPWLTSEEFIKMVSKCSVFVLPSLYETFGVVVIEAMALGKPIIVSDTSGPKDIIKNGLNGFLFEKDNIDQLTKYFDLLLNDENLRKKIGTIARKTVEENYNFDKVASEYLNLFNGILESKNV